MGDEPKEFMLNLEKRTYRCLQQMAKSMGLPSNYKKIYLIELIHAKKFLSEEVVKTIIQKVRLERLSSPKRLKNKKQRSSNENGEEGPTRKPYKRRRDDPMVSTTSEVDETIAPRSKRNKRQPSEDSSITSFKLKIEIVPKRRDNDETEEFYTRLEKIMKRLYRRDYLGIHSSSSSHTESPNIPKPKLDDGDNDQDDDDDYNAIVHRHNPVLSERDQSIASSSSKDRFEISNWVATGMWQPNTNVMSPIIQEVTGTFNGEESEASSPYEEQELLLSYLAENNDARYGVYPPSHLIRHQHS